MILMLTLADNLLFIWCTISQQIYPNATEKSNLRSFYLYDRSEKYQL